MNAVALTVNIPNWCKNEPERKVQFVFLWIFLLVYLDMQWKCACFCVTLPSA